MAVLGAPSAVKSSNMMLTIACAAPRALPAIGHRSICVPSQHYITTFDQSSAKLDQLRPVSANAGLLPCTLRVFLSLLSERPCLRHCVQERGCRDPLF